MLLEIAWLASREPLLLILLLFTMATNCQKYSKINADWRAAKELCINCRFFQLGVWKKKKKKRNIRYKTFFKFILFLVMEFCPIITNKVGIGSLNGFYDHNV